MHPNQALRFSDIDEALRVWRQTSVPVLYRRMRRGKESARVRLPFSPNNREFLRGGRRDHPHLEWVRKEEAELGIPFWKIPVAWFSETLNNIVRSYGRCWVIQPYREKEVCAPACMNAESHICSCSCGGVNHGMGVRGDWVEVSDAFAVRYGENRIACRLMVRRGA